MASNIHYSEGEFPLDLYAKPSYLNGFDLGMVNGSHWSGHGPLSNSLNNCCCNSCSNIVKLYVTDVDVSASYTITITISFSDGSKNQVTIEKGKRYTFEYLENGTVNRIVGIVTAIGKINTAITGNCPCADTNSPDYLIRVDASSAYCSSVVTIRTSNLRGIYYYTQYDDEDTTIASSTTKGATVVGTINNIRIENATIDKDGNVLEGNIVGGLVSEANCVVNGGSSTGTNPLGHSICVINGKTTGGTITGGKLISASVTSPVVVGPGSSGATITNATITAPMAKVVAVDCTVTGGKTVNGTVIEPIIYNSLVNGGTRYGSDMVTVGGTVINGVCYGGQTTGGILYGGIATGVINCQSFIIENGETTGGYTVKSIVKDGRVEGGTQMGDAIVGAIVYGGTATCGITTGGTTKLADGTIKPGISNLPDSVTCPVNVDAKFFEKEIDDFIIWWKASNGIGSNIGSVKDTIGGSVSSYKYTVGDK